jgi:hypothetical protein
MISSILACTHRVSPFHPPAARPQPCGIIAWAQRGLVSVPEPELSPHILGDVCVSIGGGTFHTDRIGQRQPPFLSRQHLFFSCSL